MSSFKLISIITLLLTLTVPFAESGFIVDSLRSLANGFCNIFHKPKISETTPLMSENIKLETSTTPYDIDFRFNGNGYDFGYSRTNGNVPKHELTRRLLAYNPLSPSGREMIHTGDC